MNPQGEERRSGADRRQNPKERDRIDEMISDFNDFYANARKFAKGVVGVLSLFAVLFYFGFNGLSERSNESKRLAKTASVLAKAIQSSRVDNIRNNCLSQNARHDGGIIALDLQLLDVLQIHVDRKKVMKLSPAVQIAKFESLISNAAKIAGREGRTLIATHDFAKAIIDALVEKRNCDQVVKEQS